MGDKSRKVESSDNKTGQSKPDKQKEEELPDLKDPDVQKATSLIQVKKNTRPN